MKSSESKFFKSDEALQAYSAIKPSILKSVSAVDHLRFIDAESFLVEARKTLVEYRKTCDDEISGLLDDLWVLDQYVDAFSSYNRMWNDIIDQKYSSSWNELQNVLDRLRWIKKFSNITVCALELQMLGLESLYPYQIFFSAGWIVDYFVCAICGNDYGSDECSHIVGELYKGKFASISPNKIIEMDHVSAVEHPADKRCVVQYPDQSNHFRNVDNLASFIRSNEQAISNFSSVNAIKIDVKNPKYRMLRRNDLCFCESGIKFKKCCISKKIVAGKFFQFVFEGKSGAVVS